MIPSPARRNPWTVVAIGYGILIFVASMMPVDARVAPGQLDKIIHVCEYLLFAWLLVQAMRLSSSVQREYLLLWAWIYATSYGLLMELLQGLVPWRSCSLADAAANAIGAALGVWLGQRTGVRER